MNNMDYFMEQLEQLIVLRIRLHDARINFNSYEAIAAQLPHAHADLKYALNELIKEPGK